MSSGPVYVQSVIVTLGMPDERLISPVTDLLDLEGEVPSEPKQRTRQGPLASGEIWDMGSFGSLARHVLRSRLSGADAETSPAAIRSIGIEILGIYGSEDLPIGARRRFVVRDGDPPRIEGQELFTEQVRRRRERRRLLADLKRDR